MYRILTNKIIDDGQLTQGEALIVDGSRIIDRGLLENMAAYGGEIIDLRGLTVMPGFIDIHVHGAMGYDVMDGTYEALESLSVHKLKEGCTSFCPTTITAPIDKIETAVKNIRSAMDKKTSGAKIIGAYLEGPWINPEYKGAHPEEFIRPVDISDIKHLIDTGGGCVASIIIAPEIPGAIDAIKTLVGMGVQVRLGHSGASFEEVEAAVDAGANLATHTFNQMSPLHHREPGMVGAVLTLPGFSGEFICDLIHTHHAAAKILAKIKGCGGMVLVTDSMAAAGLADGEYKLGELTVNVSGGVSRLPSGVLAGSTTSLVECIRNMHRCVGAPLENIIQMVTSNPAKLLEKFHKIGSLSMGKFADIVGVDENFDIRFVMVNGDVKYQHLS